ncbi:MAG: phosphatidylserine/phosphatidylglycerophosphate/cardiolipin synthase family protein [Vicinamibacterales bacterium]
MSRSLRIAAGQALSRAAGAPLVAGNAVELLRDAAENYPAWLEAIRGAKRWIHFESYIIHDDASGRRFADALIERARAGVQVRVMYDWLGGLGSAWPRFWRRLAAGGVNVRVFNPPSLRSPLSWLSRDHRKMLAVDGEVAFVTGLCVGDCWVGNPERGIDPWRDTGVSLRGPAVADVEAAFAEIWGHAGPPLPPEELVDGAAIPAAGDIALRVIATEPSTASVFRLDQLIAAVARERLWITDAYFVGVSAYVQALIAAARDGVDVRLLVPGGSDLAFVQPLSRAGYRALLANGIRVFEWNGPMVHAKTAVADGRWARVGSTNLNVQSWLGNWELDVAIEDEGFAHRMEAMYEQDLEHATEVILEARRVRRVGPEPPKRRRGKRIGRGSGSASRAAAGALRLGNTFGAALTSRRQLGAAESWTLLYGALLTLALGGIAIKWPKGLAWPIGVLLLWMGGTWLYDAWRLWRAGRQAAASKSPDDGDHQTVDLK